MKVKKFEYFNKINEEYNTNSSFNDDVKSNFPEIADEIISTINDVNTNNPREIDDVMDVIDNLISGYGVEVIRSNNINNKYWIDVVATYINLGDTYKTTILYDVINNEFLCISYGNWIENHPELDIL
jgi:hypothetical protein